MRSGLPDRLKCLSEILDRVLHPLARYLALASGLLIVIMALLVFVDIASRLIFKTPIRGMIEYQTFGLVLVLFFALAHTLIKGGHVKVDLLTGRFPPAMQAGLGVIFSVWGVYIFAVMAWELVARAVDAQQSGEVSMLTNIPWAPFYVIAALGFGLVSLVNLSILLAHAQDWMRMSPRNGGLCVLASLVGAVVFLAMPALLRNAGLDLGPVATGVVVVALIMGIMLLGMPISFAMALMGFLGLWYMMGQGMALNVLQLNAFDGAIEYYFTVVPFFILMGFVALEAGIGRRMFETCIVWFGRLPGGLAVATTAGCGGFASICGDSLATAATMGSVALPEMKKAGYDDSLATGAVAAGGTLGILVPPSLGFVIYGMITQQSIGKLFMAGLLPGVLLVVMFSAYIILRATLNPALAPRGPATTTGQKLASLRNVWPIGILFALVVGGIYSGLITPTEAGGIGLVGALVLSLFSADFTRQGFVRAAETAAEMTAMILLVLIAATVLGFFVSVSDIPSAMVQAIGSLEVSRWWVFTLIILIYIFLGMIMNIGPMIMITMPIIFPTVQSLGFDPIWFGVVVVIVMEIGQITPPIGINVFVIHGVAKSVPMAEIFRGITPFILIQILLILVLALVPGLALWLPDSMNVLESVF
ncbi:TRAP transporter large permease subunit [Frigidibacter sp. MR17.24]|uniref:TRAP transporter large permease subunit n=1 Tax=Frigidibacter sp. MR17.24 TaxID=3127345 RepID=UPI003012EB3B